MIELHYDSFICHHSREEKYIMTTSQVMYEAILWLIKELSIGQKNTERLSQETKRMFQDTDTVALECKSNLSIDEVNEHLLPHYEKNRILGAVAGLLIPNNVAA